MINVFGDHCILEMHTCWCSPTLHQMIRNNKGTFITTQNNSTTYNHCLVVSVQQTTSLGNVRKKIRLLSVSSAWVPPPRLRNACSPLLSLQLVFSGCGIHSLWVKTRFHIREKWSNTLFFVWDSSSHMYPATSNVIHRGLKMAKDNVWLPFWPGAEATAVRTVNLWKRYFIPKSRWQIFPPSL
jgi:hypothetical protein